MSYSLNTHRRRVKGSIEFHGRALADISSVLSGRRYLGEGHQKPLCLAAGWAAERFERRGWKT